MNGRTRLLIGLAVIALGLGLVALAFYEDDAAVRRVEDLLADPEGHDAGSFVLLGVPQPSEVPVTSSAGVALQPNDDWTNTTSSTIRWSRDGLSVYSTRTVQVAVDGEQATWTYTNTTRRLPTDGEPLEPPTTRTWQTAATRAFTVQAFDDGDGSTPRVWALYDGPLKDPMQPKPSQLTGHLATALPDGSPVPDGAFIWLVSDFKAGCSSKFLPPEEKARLEDSGDL